jgi:hypothetical protein
VEAVITPLLFTYVAGLDAPVVRVKVTIGSSDAVVKSSKIFGVII